MQTSDEDSDTSISWYNPSNVKKSLILVQKPSRFKQMNEEKIEKIRQKIHGSPKLAPRFREETGVNPSQDSRPDEELSTPKHAPGGDADRASESEHRAPSGPTGEAQTRSHADVSPTPALARTEAQETPRPEQPSAQGRENSSWSALDGELQGSAEQQQEVSSLKRGRQPEQSEQPVPVRPISTGRKSNQDMNVTQVTSRFAAPKRSDYESSQNSESDDKESENSFGPIVVEKGYYSDSEVVKLDGNKQK